MLIYKANAIFLWVLHSMFSVYCFNEVKRCGIGHFSVVSEENVYLAFHRLYLQMKNYGKAYRWAIREIFKRQNIFFDVFLFLLLSALCCYCHFTLSYIFCKADIYVTSALRFVMCLAFFLLKTQRLVEYSISFKLLFMVVTYNIA